MISGRLLGLVLTLLVLWFSLLCAALWRLSRVSLRDRTTRFYITVAGLICSTIAVGALLAIHLSWISVDVSQYLGAGGIKVLAMLLFWPALAGLVLSIVGSGRIRFVGIGTSLAAGLWWSALAIAAAISMGSVIARHPVRFLIPKGYVGWITIQYGENAPPLEMLHGEYICRVPISGSLATSSLLEDGWAKDEYFYYSENGRLEALSETGRGGGGMIWAGRTQIESTPGRSKRLSERFYVGREDQYRGGIGSR